MAIPYDEAGLLMIDAEFRNRIQVACLKYAKYISEEAPNIPAHNTRFKWAQNCYLQPSNVATQVQGPVVWEDAVQAAGKDVTDVDLQSAVENTINKMI